MDSIVTKLAGIAKPETPIQQDRIEVIPLVDAIDENGKTVKIRGQKQVFTAQQIDNQITNHTAILAKWTELKKAIDG